MNASAALLPDRSVLEVVGEDRLSFLQGLVTNDVEGLGEGEGRFTGLLSPQGKILFDFFVVSAGDTFLIDCPSELSRKPHKAPRALPAARQGDDCGRLGSLAGWRGLGRRRGRVGETNAALTYPDPRLPALGFRLLVRGSDQPAVLSKLCRLRSHAHRACGPRRRQGLRLWRRLPARGLLRPPSWRQLQEGLLCGAGSRVAHAASRHGANAGAGRVGGAAFAARRSGYPRRRLRGGKARLGRRPRKASRWRGWIASRKRWRRARPLRRAALPLNSPRQPGPAIRSTLSRREPRIERKRQRWPVPLPLGAQRRALHPLPRRGMGRSENARRRVLREADPGGFPVRPVLAHDPSQARGFPQGLRRVRA